MNASGYPLTKETWEINLRTLPNWVVGIYFTSKRDIFKNPKFFFK